MVLDGQPCWWSHCRWTAVEAAASSTTALAAVASRRRSKRRLLPATAASRHPCHPIREGELALRDNVHGHDGRARSGRVGCHARKDARVRPEFCTLWVRHGSGLPCGLEASAALKDSSPTCAMARARKIQASAPALAQGGNSSSRAAWHTRDGPRERSDVEEYPPSSDVPQRKRRCSEKNNSPARNGKNGTASILTPIPNTLTGETVRSHLPTADRELTGRGHVVHAVAPQHALPGATQLLDVLPRRAPSAERARCWSARREW